MVCLVLSIYKCCLFQHWGKRYKRFNISRVTWLSNHKLFLLVIKAANFSRLAKTVAVFFSANLWIWKVNNKSMRRNQTKYWYLQYYYISHSQINHKYWYLSCPDTTSWITTVVKHFLIYHKLVISNKNGRCEWPH